MPERFREDDFHAFIRSHANALGPHVLQGPGDDLAVMDFHGHSLLMGVDQVIEGVHFVPGTAPEAIGRKAVTRNISDVAAMACRPVATLASCVLPMDVSPGFAERLVDAVRRTAQQFNAPLVGGDTALHRNPGPLTLSVTVLAEPLSPTRAPVLRSTAKADDRLFVTGLLGGSLRPDGLGRHLDFEPRVDEAEALATTLGESLHAMMDLSDGLAQDAARMALASGLQAVIDAAALPCSPGCGWRNAMGDGEDYELFLAVGGGRAVPTHVGRSRTPTRAIGLMRAMPSPDAPRVICMLNDIEMAVDHLGRFNDGKAAGA
jgi:thiamine-monophosphate kinase